MPDKIRPELWEAAEDALAAYYTSFIREQEDPDHSGPEDAARVLAERCVENGLAFLSSHDWRGLLE